MFAQISLTIADADNDVSVVQAYCQITDSTTVADAMAFYTQYLWESGIKPVVSGTLVKADLRLIGDLELFANQSADVLSDVDEKAVLVIRANPDFRVHFS